MAGSVVVFMCPTWKSCHCKVFLVGNGSGVFSSPSRDCVLL